MRLFEAIVDANARKVAGDRAAMVAASEFASNLPVAGLTCIDARLNHLFPEMLGLPEEQFVWLRNAGNIITGSLSSTMRSLALACVVKGAKEIAIIGHTDCLVGHTTAMQLLERLAAVGVDRQHLPDNLVEYFGLFATERQNVLRGIDFVRASPLIGSAIPVHGLLIDVGSGRLEWLVNGYEAPAAKPKGRIGEVLGTAEQALNVFSKIGNTAATEFKMPEQKIGDVVSIAEDWLQRAAQVAKLVAPNSPAQDTPSSPPPQPVIPGSSDPLRTLQERMRQFNEGKPKSPRIGNR